MKEIDGVCVTSSVQVDGFSELISLINNLGEEIMDSSETKIPQYFKQVMS